MVDLGSPGRVQHAISTTCVSWSISLHLTQLLFSPADWFHKVMASIVFLAGTIRKLINLSQVFVQLIVFSAMAAFTQNFDITVGLDKDSDQAAIDALQAASGTNKNEFSASMFRNNRLPILNARGVSMAMGISRIVLLMQYSAGKISMFERSASYSRALYSILPRKEAAHSMQLAVGPHTVSRLLCWMLLCRVWDSA